MDFKIKKLEVFAGIPIIFLDESQALDLNVHIGDRIKIIHNSKTVIAKLDIIKKFLTKTEIALSEEILSYLKVKPGDLVKIAPVPKAISTGYIAKKMNGKTLTKKEIFSIIKDVVDNVLSEVEIAQFVLAVYRSGMSYEETIYLTEAMYKTGSILKWPSKEIVDKHCIGGIAGNRTTPIVVSICASLGLTMPKTSSRAITSAAGTADVVETLCNVDFTDTKLQSIVRKTGACLAWGGSLGLAPADDKLIRVERILNLDPESQLIASILSKKLAAGSRYVLIDIPFGPEAKVSKFEGEELRDKFLKMANAFNLKMRVVLTHGDEPIGNGIGPTLEMLDVLKVLKRDNPPKDLETKAIFLASQILEMTGKCKPGEGELLALKALDSGNAYKKFQEIINAQGRKKSILKPAKYSKTITANKSGLVVKINNKEMNLLASVLGCPIDERSGIYLYRHIGDKVSKGDKLMTFYSESEQKLSEAIKRLKDQNPISIS